MVRLTLNVVELSRDKACARQHRGFTYWTLYSPSVVFSHWHDFTAVFQRGAMSPFDDPPFKGRTLKCYRMRRGLAESYKWYVAGQAEEVQRSRRPIMQRLGEDGLFWPVADFFL